MATCHRFNTTELGQVVFLMLINHDQGDPPGPALGEGQASGRKPPAGKEEPPGTDGGGGVLHSLQWNAPQGHHSPGEHLLSRVAHTHTP